MANDQEKEAAARASLRFIQDGQVVGLGTGSTAAYFIKLLGEQVKQGMRICGIPTSDRSRELADDYLVMERGEFIARGRGQDMDAHGVRQLVAI